jgi:hypothetical protein
MPAVQQLRMAIRDQRALASALELDRATDAEFRDLINNVLESVDHIAADDELWGQLAEAAGQPLDVDWSQFDHVASSALPYVLTACGYHEPPPPPAAELSEDFLAALASATTVSRTARPAAVQAARARITALAGRIREQISFPVPAPVRRKWLRRLARGACWLAREVIVPMAVAVAPLALGLIPGIGPVAAIVGAAATPLITLGANAFVGWVAGRVQEPEPRRPEWTYDATMEIKHITAIFERIDSLAGMRGDILDPITAGNGIDTAVWARYSEIVGEISAHAVRINDMVGARETQDPVLMAASAQLVTAAKALTAPGTITEGWGHFDSVVDGVFLANQSVAGRL